MTTSPAAGTTTGTGIDLDTPYPVTDGHRAAMAEHGFVRLPGVLGEQTVRHYEPAVTGKVLELNDMHLPMAERDTYQKAFLQVMNLWQHDEQVRELVFSPRLARIAAELLGVRGVRLYHDQALYKEAGGGITPWHADQYYWPLDSDRVCTVWIPLQDTPHEMGPLAFARGSHRFEWGRDLPIGDESERELQKRLTAQDFPYDTEPYALGDASFHLGWTFHRAEPNRSATPRRVMTVIYMDADIRVCEPVNHMQRADRADWLSGAAVGTVPDGPLNPVLWQVG